MKKLTRETVINVVKNLAKEESQDGLEIVGIFGSYARNTPNEFSDVDIAYKIDHSLFSQKYKDGFSKLLKIEEIKELLQERLHHKVDLVSLNGSNEKLQANMLKEMVYV